MWSLSRCFWTLNFECYKLNYWTDIHKYSFIHVRTSFIAMKITVFLKSNHPWERSVYIAADNDNIISSCLPSHTEDRGYWGWLEDGRWRWSCFVMLTSRFPVSTPPDARVSPWSQYYGPSFYWQVDTNPRRGKICLTPVKICMRPIESPQFFLHMYNISKHQKYNFQLGF